METEPIVVPFQENQTTVQFEETVILVQTQDAQTILVDGRV